MDENYQEDDLSAPEQFLPAFNLVNGIALRIGQNLQSSSERLTGYGQELIAIGAQPTAFSATQVNEVFSSISNDLNHLTQLISGHLAPLRLNIEIAGQHAPHIGDWIDMSGPGSHVIIRELLSSFSTVLDAVSAAVNDLESFQENIAALKGIDDSVDEAAKKLMVALDDLRLPYNEYWFLCGDMKASIESKLNEN